MKNDFTKRNHCPDSRAVKVKLAGAGYALLAAILLCIALLAPQPLSAADDVGNAKQAVGHQLYFGNFPQTYTGRTGAVSVPAVSYVLKPNTRDLDEQLKPYTGYFLVEPVRWRVLADDAEGILLLSEFNLANWAYNTGGTTSWELSSVRDSLRNQFLLGSTALGLTKDYFSPIETGAIKPSVLQNPKLGEDLDGITTTDSVFLLADVDSTLFASAADRIAKNTAYAASYTNTSGPNEVDVWLLRTHGASFFAGYTMYVREESGHIDRYGLANITPSLIRPALRLSRDRFVMLSNSKPGAVNTPSNVLTGGVTDIMKLTLVDPAINLTVNGGADYIPLTTPNLTTLTYSVNSSTGTDDYISVLVEELGGGAVYYSKLVALPSGSSSASLSVTFDGTGSYPSFTPGASYTVKIFREQINSSPSEPDLASVPKVFTVGIASGSPAPADITTNDLLDGWVNVYYSDKVNFTGNPAPVLSVTGLPPGLTLEPDGTLHGTPTETDPDPYHITVTANNGISVSKEYDVKIQPSSAPVITHPDAGLIDSVLRGTSIDIDTVEASGAPAPTFTVSSGLLPDGMSLDPVTGRIYGTPSKEQYATFTVKASNPLGDDYREYNIKVKLANNPVAPHIDMTALPDAYATLPYECQMVFTGEPAPTFLVMNGLPSGLTLDPGTGEISGTPVTNSYLASPYNVRIRMTNGVTVTQDFPMVVNATLPPPHLELTTATPTVGTDPFEVTAKFDLPVSDLDLLTQIKVTNGTASNLQMVSPTATVPPRATVWTFDVTPGASISNGTVIEACIPAGAALSAEGATTYADSDTARVAFQSDQPIVQFSTSSGKSYVKEPDPFWFDVFPNGTGAYANTAYVNGAPASDANIRNAVEIRRDGVLYDEWEATVSGAHVAFSGVFRQGSYDVVLKPNSLGNNVGKFAVQTVFQFSVQLSTSWCEGCPQTFTLSPYTALGVDRTVSIACDGALAGYLTGIDGGAAPASVTLPAIETEVTLSFRTLAVPDELEGDSVTITVTDPGPPVRTDVFRVKLYNRPKVENVVFIPATTRYPGYFKLVKGGSPALRRSFDAGQHWSNAWETATDLELSDAGEEIILREPDGCYSLVIPLDVSISASVQRSIHLSGTANIVTLPGAGEHSVFSGADFSFLVTMTGPLAGHRPLVTTDRQHVPDSVGTVVEPNDDGSFTVTLRAVREPVHVTLAAGELLTGNAGVEGTQVWASGGQLYISSAVNGEAKVYTLTGALLKSVTVAAGQTVRTGLPPGVFFVKPGDGRTFKVSGF